MDRKIKLFIDIVNSIDLIDEFLGPINLFEEYTVDLKTKSAIERQLGIVGEAKKKIKELDPQELIRYQKDIIGFRNILIHNYDTIDDAVVWSIIREDLISLKVEVLEKLEYQ
ncbi:MAG: HepT-like ribonuclease domain-containing protein [Mucilaginibacter sp.]